MAAKQSPDCEHSATPPAAFHHSLSGIFRASRSKTASMAKQRRDPTLVGTKQNFHHALAIRDLCEGGYHLPSFLADSWWDLPNFCLRSGMLLLSVPSLAFCSTTSKARATSAQSC